MLCNCGTGAGAVYRARLESVCWVKPTEGSNPSLSVALARTGCLISRRGRTDGAGAGPRGRNPDRNLSLKNRPIPPRRWVFRSNAEACMNSAVALQRQPYPGVGCLGRVRFASGPFGNLKGCCRPDIRPVLRVGDQTPTHWIRIDIGPLLT